MRLELETDDIAITVTVPGNYIPDVMDDMANRLLDTFAKATAIQRAYNPDSGDG